MGSVVPIEHAGGVMFEFNNGKVGVEGVKELF